MIKLVRAGALALALFACLPVAADTPVPQVTNAAGNKVPGQGAMPVDHNAVELFTSTNPGHVQCDSGCSGGGGGGGSIGATSTAANPTYTEGNTAAPLSLDLTGRLRTFDANIGAASSPAIGTTNYLLGQLVTLATDTSTPSPVSIDHTTPGTTDMVRIGGTLPAFAATPTFNIGTGGLGASGNPINATLQSAGTVGSTAPTIANQFGGKSGDGNLRAVQTSTSGGLVPGQATPTSTRTTLTANAITTIDTAHGGRLLLTVQADGSPNAAIYICMNGQSATCSATVYDVKIASGASDAAMYTAPFGTSSANIYAFTTGTGNVVNVTSWIIG